jgi:hypothetical protein
LLHTEGPFDQLVDTAEKIGSWLVWTSLNVCPVANVLHSDGGRVSTPLLSSNSWMWWWYEAAHELQELAPVVNMSCQVYQSHSQEYEREWIDRCRGLEGERRIMHRNTRMGGLGADGNPAQGEDSFLLFRLVWGWQHVVPGFAPSTLCFLGEDEIGGCHDILFWKCFRKLILQSRQGKKVKYRNLITVLIDDVLFVHAFSSIKAGSAKSHGTSSIKTVMRLRYFIFLACRFAISLPLTEKHPMGGNWRAK